ncbi:hypothetical protein RRG08_033531 [Elysia crispata]|uniref:Uncharacterized protein n=1 Tax=Elysia crispata TaxID=231223 RepID=A0AAE1CJD6_9GAST|nr:hypothetical protein RRG08_033531 [Elysia crispata]
MVTHTVGGGDDGDDDGDGGGDDGDGGGDDGDGGGDDGDGGDDGGDGGGDDGDGGASAYVLRKSDQIEDKFGQLKCASRTRSAQASDLSVAIPPGGWTEN